MLTFLLLAFLNNIQAVDLGTQPPIEFQFYPVHPKLYADGSKLFDLLIFAIKLKLFFCKFKNPMKSTCKWRMLPLELLVIILIKSCPKSHVLAQPVQVSLQELDLDGNFRLLTTTKPGRFLPKYELSPNTWFNVGVFSKSSTFKRLAESEKDYFGDREGYIGTDVIQVNRKSVICEVTLFRLATNT